jgi:hypothetical protein
MAKTRNRVIYQSEALYVGQPTGSGPHINAVMTGTASLSDRVHGLVKEPESLDALCILDNTDKWDLVTKPEDRNPGAYTGATEYAKETIVYVEDTNSSLSPKPRWYFEAKVLITDSETVPPIVKLLDFKENAPTAAAIFGTTNDAGVAVSLADFSFKPAVKQLNRVQSANYSFTMNRQDVNQFGQLHRIDSVAIDPPTVSLDFSYYINNGGNEKLMGFNIEDYSALTGGTATNFLNTAKQEDDYEGRNFFILTTPQGTDAVENSDFDNNADTNHSVIALGNGFVTNYGLEASVGGMPTASVTVEGLNLKSDSGFHNIDIPAVDNGRGTPIEGMKFSLPTPVSGVLNDGAPAEADEWVLKSDPDVVISATDYANLTDNDPLDGSPRADWDKSAYEEAVYDGDLFAEHAEGWSCLRPGDIEMHLGSEGNAAVMTTLPAGTPPTDHTVKSCHVQSFSIDMPMGRTPLQRLGTPYAYTRPLDFPLVVNISVSAIVSDLKKGNIAEHLFNFENHDLHFILREPQVGGAGPVAMAFYVRGAQIEGESFSSSIGDNKSVDITFSCQVGGPEDTTKGLMVGGSRGALAAALLERFDPATK